MSGLALSLPSHMTCMILKDGCASKTQVLHPLPLLPTYSLSCVISWVGNIKEKLYANLKVAKICKRSFLKGEEWLNNFLFLKRGGLIRGLV